ncbi:glycosyltransferase [Erythrobacter alti]|uniref:glycosyltransferase n=1 Tax=Erythrobacter alti TaxID=1896145 RepID=UPI0030F3869C
MSDSKPLDIGFVCTSMSRKAGGVSVVLRRAVQGLAALGCKVKVYALRDEYSEADLAEWGDIAPVLLDPVGSPSLGYAPGLAKRLGDHDLLHQHGIWQGPSIAVNNWRRRTGKPVVISPHGMLDPWALANSGWKKRLAGAFYENANLRGAACLHALAEAEARAIRAAGFSNPVAQIPNGIDLPQAPCPPATGKGRKTLLFLGRLHPKKGLSELLTAWGMIATDDPDFVARWRVVIAGWDDGGHADALKAQAEALPDAAEVEFTGALHGGQKHEALCTADAFVLPSHSEGLPIAVLEAWAYDTPAFITDACNLPEGFAHDAAIRVTTDPAELANVLRTRLEDPELAEIARRARALVERKFTWDSVAQQYLTTYQWLLGHRDRPDFVSETD